MAKRDIVVIGASAGGVEALTTVLSQLPAGLCASVFVVLHISPQSPSDLAAVLDRRSALKAVQTRDESDLEHGHVYLPCRDHHLIIRDGKIRSVRGPKENLHRPAIDPLFRTAAQTYGSRVTGVILTGALDAGSAGLRAI